MKRKNYSPYENKEKEPYLEPPTYEEMMGYPEPGTSDYDDGYSYPDD